jgi:hypothetical protein
MHKTYGEGNVITSLYMDGRELPDVVAYIGDGAA